MRKTPSIKSYLRKRILRQTIIGLVAMMAISATVTFFLGRYKMATDLQKSALSAAQAFRSRILEGDIKSVEAQIHDVLGLSHSEIALILNKDFQRLYKSPSNIQLDVFHCEPLGIPCFDGYFGQGKILLPIYFDENAEHLFGFLYLTKSVQFDWLFLIIVFLIFCIGYAALLFGLTNTVKRSSEKLAQEVEEWSFRLKHNPKDKTPLSVAPFSELLPLKQAIEGLTTQIENFENKASEKAKMLILRGIAHDVLSPISQVQLYTATLEKRLEHKQEFDDILKEIKSSIKKVSLIATQMKLLREEITSIEPIDLVATVNEEVQTLRRDEKLSDNSIEIDFSTEYSEILVPIARVEVSRILQNLIHNSANASEPNSKISVKLSKDGQESTISIKDNGRGIPFHLHKKVFEPDFTSKPATGTGLGLFIVKHICEQRGGRIELDSKDGQGTTVAIKFPMIQETTIHAT